ncbi:MAG: radical SAM protein [Desulfatibacillum sp.]|nr:radical SAM protein [Desulfatibacillum sp.]
MELNTVAPLVANEEGEIFELEGYAAVGASGNYLAPLDGDRAIVQPHGSETLFLPDRVPVVLDLDSMELVALEENPYNPGEAIFPVATFNSPGYIATASCAFVEDPGAQVLPLFSYGACGWDGQDVVAAALRVDRSRRQDLRLMPLAKVESGVKRFRKKMPDNRLARHLEHCALTYGCPAAKNMFIGREEAPLPTAQTCNAKCLGCLSLQKDSPIPHSQDRINFTPTAEEIAQVALEHLSRVKQGVVSFGQGCEGEPLLATKVIAPAIAMIREQTSNGTINLNTNGSRPDLLEQCLDAGLDSIRVSINSVRPECYQAYFRPSYDFKDVLKCIDLAGSRGKWVSINYLNMPGFTDSPEEAEAFLQFLGDYPVTMIQWRNMNFNPRQYYDAMAQAGPCSTPLGVEAFLDEITRLHPKVRFGYFNPPKESF